MISSAIRKGNGAGASGTPSLGSSLHCLDAKYRSVNQELVKGQFLWKETHALFLNGEAHGNRPSR